MGSGARAWLGPKVGLRRRGRRHWGRPGASNPSPGPCPPASRLEGPRPMAPTPPHTPSHSSGAAGSRRPPGPGTQPPRRRRPRRHLATAAGGRWAHPIALILTACCAASLTLLTACAKDAPPTEVTGTLPTRFFSTPDASADASATPAASASPSLSPELQAQRASALAEPKPVIPPEASENTEEGAVTAAFYFLQLYRYAFITGDTTDLAAMSEDRCTFCSSAANDATKLHQEGGWANPWELDIQSIDYIPKANGKDYDGVRVKVQVGDSITVNGAGDQVRHNTKQETIFVALRYYDGSWHIGETGVES